MKSKIFKIITDNDVDAILITNKHDITYVSNFTGEEAWVLITKNNLYIITDIRYMEQARAQCSEFILSVIDENANFEQTLENLLQLNDVKKLGVDICDIKYVFYSQLKNMSGNFEIINLEEPFKESRAIKSQEEIVKIKKACEIADKTFHGLLKIITEGMSEKDIEIEMNYLIKREEGDGYAFQPIIGVEEKTSMPYSLPEKHVIVKRGNFILLNFGVIYEGYTSAVARMVSVGAVKSEYENIYSCLYDVYIKVLNSIKPYMEYEKLYSIFENEINHTEYKDYFLKAIGHGRGLQTIEGYVIRPKVNRTIMPNEVYSIGISISIPGFGGARLEDVVLVKENEIEILTNSVRNLINI
ncbi:MAG: Xaa-Pro peptidase family protein [Sedimentibacter sp.]|uniref:M24 family metallopeptidase n=1 Tax=Sedimentibacter sp. TaxID=1960295 RepID=UPI00315828D0